MPGLLNLRCSTDRLPYQLLLRHETPLETSHETRFWQPHSRQRLFNHKLPTPSPATSQTWNPHRNIMFSSLFGSLSLSLSPLSFHYMTNILQWCLKIKIKILYLPIIIFEMSILKHLR